MNEFYPPSGVGPTLSSPFGHVLAYNSSAEYSIYHHQCHQNGQSYPRGAKAQFFGWVFGGSGFCSWSENCCAVCFGILFFCALFSDINFALRPLYRSIYFAFAKSNFQQNVNTHPRHATPTAHYPTDTDWHFADCWMQTDAQLQYRHVFGIKQSRGVHGAEADFGPYMESESLSFQVKGNPSKGWLEKFIKAQTIWKAILLSKNYKMDKKGTFQITFKGGEIMFYFPKILNKKSILRNSFVENK